MAYIKCGRLFDGVSDRIRNACVVEIAEGRIVAIHDDATKLGRDEPVIDLSGKFVMPGLIDVHTHLAYGNARSNEETDFYGSPEFRAVRGMYFAQRVMASGVTSIGAPGGSGNVSVAIRDAIDANLFDGPTVTATGPYIGTQQGFVTEWYPTWIDVPSTAIGRVVRNVDEAIDEVRRQLRDGVNAIKLAMDGLRRRPNGDVVATFTEEETMRIVGEIHRQGATCIAHAMGREATLYSAKAGVDLIIHAVFTDDECIEWITRNKCRVSPSLTFVANLVDFSQPHDPLGKMKPMFQFVLQAACASARKLREAGVPLPTGTDSGFAITPYGEWHTRELELYVEKCGFSPVEALKSATSVAAAALRQDSKVGRIAPGYAADLIAIDGDPAENIRHVSDRARLSLVMKNGKEFRHEARAYDRGRVSDLSHACWVDLYTRDRVKELSEKGMIAKGVC